MNKWWSVTYRAQAEMTVWVKADSAADARARAENVEYEDVTPIEFVRGKPYTMKARPAPNFQPEDLP